MHVENTIEIAAPQLLVWEVTTEMPSWPLWTPTMTSVEPLKPGGVQVGSRYRVKQPRMPASVWTVTVLDSPQRLVWETQRWGVRLVATHEVSAFDGRTRSYLAIDLDGVVGQVIWPIFQRIAPKFLVQENQGLKAYCESRAAGSTAS